MESGPGLAAIAEAETASGEHAQEYSFEDDSQWTECHTAFRCACGAAPLENTDHYTHLLTTIVASLCVLCRLMRFVHRGHAEALAAGELVHSSTFTLMQAMSALELMDPKMDAGMQQVARW